MKSEFPYTPNAYKNPCFKGHHCNNFAFGCKEKCDDWQLHQQEKEKVTQAKISFNNRIGFQTSYEKKLLRRYS